MLGSENEVEFHLLPCKIDYNGPAKVSGYMLIDKDESCKGSFTSTLRGRGLLGKDLEIGEKFKYSTISIKKQSDSEGWKLDKKASKLTVWQHDQRPSYLNSAAMSAPAWIELSNAIHTD